MGCRHGLAIQVDEVGEVANRPSCSGNDTYISLASHARLLLFLQTSTRRFFAFFRKFFEM